MALSTDEILSRIAFLEKDMERLHRQLVLAAGYVENDPGSAMVKARVVLETVVARAYERLVGAPRGQTSLAGMVNDDGFRERVPRRIVSRMNSVRDMCNVAAHEDVAAGERDDVKPADALAVLRGLCEIIEWYMEAVEGPREVERAEEGFVWDREHPRLELSVKLMDRFHYCAHERNVIREALEASFGWGEKAASLAFLALNELVDNAFEHGCRGRGGKAVRIELVMEGDTLTVTVRDEGDGFDLEQVLASEREGPSGRRRGRGLLMVKHIASDLVAAEGGRTARAVLGQARLDSSQPMALYELPAPRGPRRRKRRPDAGGSRFEYVPVDDVFLDPSWAELLEQLRRGD